MDTALIPRGEGGSYLCLSLCLALYIYKYKYKGLVRIGKSPHSCSPFQDGLGFLSAPARTKKPLGLSRFITPAQAKRLRETNVIITYLSPTALHVSIFKYIESTFDCQPYQIHTIISYIARLTIW